MQQALDSLKMFSTGPVASLSRLFQTVRHDDDDDDCFKVALASRHSGTNRGSAL